MGKVIPMLGGGGTDLDMITATASDVRAGKVIVDKEGNPVTGTEPERGNWTGNVAMNGKITIPDGHHGGGGYVNGPVVTQRGAWNGSVGMNTQVAIPEGYHNGAGKVSGPSVAYQNADISGTDRANATNRSCWDGTICLGVRNGHYLNGVNWIQYSDPNFKASNFKKGVPIMGLTGTFEGYVPIATDLYLRGNNPANFHLSGNANRKTIASFDSGQITLTQPRNSSTMWDGIYGRANLAGYSYVNFDCYWAGTSTAYSVQFFITNDEQCLNTIASTSIRNTNGGGNFTCSLNVSSIQASRFVGILPTLGTTADNTIYIYRIWLS